MGATPVTVAVIVTLDPNVDGSELLESAVVVAATLPDAVMYALRVWVLLPPGPVTVRLTV